MHNIIYTYKNFDKEEFNNNVHFDEEVFSEKLQKVFEKNNQVERITVVMEKIGEKELHCVISTFGGDKEIRVEETSYNPTESVLSAIRQAIKKTSHRE